MHRQHAARSLRESFAAAEIGTVASVFCASDVIAQAIFIVMIQAVRRLVLAVNDKRAGHFPVALRCNGFFYIVLNLLNRRVPT